MDDAQLVDIQPQRLGHAGAQHIDALAVAPDGQRAVVKQRHGGGRADGAMHDVWVLVYRLHGMSRARRRIGKRRHGLFARRAVDYRQAMALVGAQPLEDVVCVKPIAFVPVGGVTKALRRLDGGIFVATGHGEETAVADHRDPFVAEPIDDRIVE